MSQPLDSEPLRLEDELGKLHDLEDEPETLVGAVDPIGTSEEDYQDGHREIREALDTIHRAIATIRRGLVAIDLELGQDQDIQP